MTTPDVAGRMDPARPLSGRRQFGVAGRMAAWRTARPRGALVVGWALSLVLLAAPVAAPLADQDTPSGPAQVITEATSRHTLTIEGETLAYTVKVGTIGLPEEGGPTDARLVYTAYTLDATDPASRPLSFVVNGGPGAASAYLHLGALGPARLVFGPGGRAPAPPARVDANPKTWLAFTDLVFIDPVGTGFSRVSPRSEEGDQGGNEREFWNVDDDLRALAGFIRQFLTRNERWQSPKVLVGESYGGFRMAALADRLPRDYSVALNGVVLVSPALEFGLQGGAEWDLLPWVLRVPSMAAVAREHGKAQGPRVGPSDARQTLAEIEEFALGPLLSGLARGGGRSAGNAVFEELAGDLGLKLSTVTRNRGRISTRTFAEGLLEEEDRVVSLYDGRLAAPKTRGRNEDRYLPQITAALAGGYADYVRNELGVGANLPYLVLNEEVFRRWGWDAGGHPGRERVGAADELADALISQPTLRALVVHGAHDLVTPYFASVYLLDQLVTDDAARDRLAVRVYPGGHMFYALDDSLALFAADAAAFFREVTAGLAPGG